MLPSRRMPIGTSPHLTRDPYTGLPIHCGDPVEDWRAYEFEKAVGECLAADTLEEEAPGGAEEN